MNKILSLSLICGAALTLGSCAGEEDDLFDQSAAERLNAISDTYSKRLMASENGWAMQLYPQNTSAYPQGAGYLLLMRFNSDHSVKVGMNNAASSNNYAEDTSVWDIITDQGPVLSFSTYNKCLHAFTNPEDLAFTEDVETGTGMGGDYEYIIVDAPEDASYMMLKGKKRSTYNLLTPLQENVDFEQYLADVKAFQSKMFAATSPTFDVIHIGDSAYKMEDASEGIPNIYPYDGNAIIDEHYVPFLITKRGDDYYLRFRNEIEAGEVSVQDFRYNTATDRFESTEHDNCYITGDSPIRFFAENMTENSGKWKIDTDNMSESFSAIYNDAADDFKSRKLTLRYTQINAVGADSMNVIMQYSGKTTTNVKFAYRQTFSDNGATFTYLEPVGSAGNVLAAVPKAETLVNTLSQQFTVSATETSFNLSTLKLTSVADASIWFYIIKQ